ncbi:hypothetical protein PHYBLDRAFT_158931 [Phycomyces blakesleeanus NRRL 1555(-)]|uniref:Uncharacterized protein n=1 Tax=Phycomyces blakesleeanus (strain ATCC 8743b / DSM 1359 / FGSC 10004 / NBRC 33097 / NRRL 1555) TaxID=763407 RepID=A0A162U9D5_PHYB8|nr:hypothetical protein PHYBLDRAFT_158931 [Phycomyces blakesleeanus NRRL 1555(-)]OAD73413.1 hypothetical protein PHYBLDRAFT_158931 [Phycomyces blakesleeanus NRRL 1555(-)]|eukprot:XP_018291453.1 hypothetical protein PHYBLDRAFT_158931 [Phycomyces blakesleeanus NRRL 1555(-)]
MTDLDRTLIDQVKIIDLNEITGTVVDAVTRRIPITIHHRDRLGMEEWEVEAVVEIEGILIQKTIVMETLTREVMRITRLVVLLLHGRLPILLGDHPMRTIHTVNRTHLELLTLILLDARRQ